MGFSLIAASRGYSALHRLLTAVASFVAEHRLEGTELQQLQHSGSIVVVPQALVLCGMWNLPGAGIEPTSPALDSYPLYYQGSFCL